MFEILPLPGPQGVGQKTCAVAHTPMNVSNSHTKFGWISSNGLGGDSITHRLTNRGNYNIPLGIIIMADCYPDCSLSSNMAANEIVNIENILHLIYFA